MTELLCVALGLIPTIGGPTREMERLFDASHSLHQDSVSWSKVFLTVVKTNNTEMFMSFSDKVPNPRQNGETVLLEAARLENYQAIDWLLALGVSIQSLTATKDNSASANETLPPIQSRDFRLHSKFAFSPRMNDYLSRKGLHLEPIVEIFDPLLELKSLLRKGSN